MTRYYCRQCGRRERAPLPPAGWLRVQIADPELAASRAAGWSSSAAGGVFCGLACLIAWATDQAASTDAPAADGAGAGVGVGS